MSSFSWPTAGAGIPAEDRARVLDRFVRLDSSRSKPGNGLGLSLVAGVMKLHGGALLLEDNAPGPARQAGASASRERKLVWPHDWGFFGTAEAAFACTA